MSNPPFSSADAVKKMEEALSFVGLMGQKTIRDKSASTEKTSGDVWDWRSILDAELIPLSIRDSSGNRTVTALHSILHYPCHVQYADGPMQMWPDLHQEKCQALAAAYVGQRHVFIDFIRCIASEAVSGNEAHLAIVQEHLYGKIADLWGKSLAATKNGKHYSFQALLHSPTTNISKTHFPEELDAVKEQLDRNIIEVAIPIFKVMVQQFVDKIVNGEELSEDSDNTDAPSVDPSE